MMPIDLEDMPHRIVEVVSEGYPDWIADTLAGAADELQALRAKTTSQAELQPKSEAQMALEIMRAIRRDYSLELTPIDTENGGWRLDSYATCLCVAQAETIPALHAAMVEAGMIGSEVET